MTTIRDAVNALRIDLQEHETVCIVFKTRKGHTREYPQFNFHDVADEPIGPDTFVSTGTFRVDTDFTRKGSRATDSVLRVWAIPLDVDIKDFLDCESDDLWLMDDAELDMYRADVRHSIEETCRMIGWPIHRLDSTGYGVAAYTYLPHHEQEAVKVAQDYHGRIVDRINKVWNGKLVDPGVRDAGSRIMRLVPGGNAKAVAIGGPIRETSTIYFNPVTRVDEAVMQLAAGPRFDDAARFVPRVGKGLPDAVADQIVTVFSRYWSLGQRHFMGNAVSGWLAKNGVSEEQAISIIERLSINDNKKWDRRKSVRDAYARYRQGLAVRGYQALADLVDTTELQGLDLLLTPYREAGAEGIILRFGEKVISGDDVDDKKRPVRFEEYPEPPDTAFYGWFGDYVDLMYPTTEAPRGFHLVCALTVAGSIVGRKVSVQYNDRLFANQYNLLVGPTGTSRKGTAMKRAWRLPEYLAPGAKLHKPPYGVRRDIGSGPALVKTLSESSNTLVGFEEISSLFANINRKGGESLLDRLIEAWDSPASLQDNVKTNANEARDPFLSIIGATQPGRLEDALGAREIDSGLANRMGIFFGVRHHILPRAQDVDEAMAYQLYRRFWTNVVDGYNEGDSLKMSDEASAIWDPWYRAYSKDHRSEDENAMRIRHPSMIQKWALLFAISDRARQIEAHHLEAAMAVLDWMWEGIKRRLPTWGVSIDNKIEALIFQAIEQSDKPLKRRELQQKTARRSWSGRDFANVFKAMVDNGHLKVSLEGYVVLAEVAERMQAEALKEAA